MLIGYNTNAMAHHDPFDAVRVLSEIGYRSVAVTLDHGPLNPMVPGFADAAQRMGETLCSLGIRSTVETGARYLLDPRIKHEPTLMTADAAGRESRIEFLCRCIDAAAQWGSDCVSLWSGKLREPLTDEEALERLKVGLEVVLDYAAQRDVVIGFEPEPGMFIATMSHFERLLQWCDSPQLQLTMDLGHLYCQGEVPLSDYIDRWKDRIVNVHLEDMRAGHHEHLMFGEGEMSFPPIIAALQDAGYAGPIHVELSRHSHMGPIAAQQAYDFLHPLISEN